MLYLGLIAYLASIYLRPAGIFPSHSPLVVQAVNGGVAQIPTVVRTVEAHVKTGEPPHLGCSVHVELCSPEEIRCLGHMHSTLTEERYTEFIIDVNPRNTVSRRGIERAGFQLAASITVVKLFQRWDRQWNRTVVDRSMAPLF